MRISRGTKSKYESLAIFDSGGPPSTSFRFIFLKSIQFQVNGVPSFAQHHVGGQQPLLKNLSGISSLLQSLDSTIDPMNMDDSLAIHVMEMHTMHEATKSSTTSTFAIQYKIFFCLS